ncbi:NlpC/P60 family protein [Dongia deserti]|uniref:NlpC/P60 family protein n=1 Tax=Dongia deserti TaxID=2268030 RepID=UPI000E64D691|nr:NlpC/P60 family protein [Dongia deserti]
MADNLIRRGVVTATLVSAGIARPRIVAAGGTPPNAPEPWVRPYVGLPWKELGRDRQGVDCWGLHRLPLLEVFGCDTPLYETGYVGCSRRDVPEIATLIAAGKAGWHIVREPGYEGGLCPIGDERPGDSLLIRQHGEPSHIALVAGGGHMLHIEEGTDSVCVPYTERDWRRRIVGIYRHPGLVQS